MTAPRTRWLPFHTRKSRAHRDRPDENPEGDKWDRQVRQGDAVRPGRSHRFSPIPHTVKP